MESQILIIPAPKHSLYALRPGLGAQSLDYPICWVWTEGPQFHCFGLQEVWLLDPALLPSLPHPPLA